MTSWGCIAALASCSHATTYGYQYRLDQQFGGTEEPEQPPVEARQLLASAHTIAFYPPEVCVDKEAGKNTTMVARCGALLSKLERDAERAGYEVVSWVNLRGSQRPIDYAREAKVDVLFEINEMLPQTVKDVDVQRKLTFFERADDVPDRELQVSNGVAQRCHDWAKKDGAINAGLTSTLDIKTVSVVDGRARWHYRKTVSESSGEDFPKVRFVGVSQPNKAVSVLGGLGLAGVIVGVVFAGVDASQAGTPDPVTGVPSAKLFGDAPYYVLAGGIVSLVIAGVVMVATSQSKPDPENVLCLDAHVPANGTIEARPVARGPMSSQHTFSESTVTDPLAKLEDRMSEARVTEFFAIVGAIHRQVPAPAPVTPVAAPAPSPSVP